MRLVIKGGLWSRKYSIGTFAERIGTFGVLPGGIVAWGAGAVLRGVWGCDTPTD